MTWIWKKQVATKEGLTTEPDLKIGDRVRINYLKHYLHHKEGIVTALDGRQEYPVVVKFSNNMASIFKLNEIKKIPHLWEKKA